MRDDSEERSLEALEERMEKRWSDEEGDEEVALEELIDAMVSPLRVGGPSIPKDVGDDEFTCTSCWLVRPRASLVDFVRMTCAECVGSRARSGADA